MNDLNDQNDHLSEADGSAAKFNADAQQHATKAVDQDESLQPQQPRGKHEQEEEDPIESYGL
ncbi:hypothetical protein IM792_14575 [Mucilaginibacter sp. JRF]|uniref:hypothetical protein n=1 Tax=Mucilaginibacter sp. JRF TaxID=2780088 RepID=UPI0018808E35|nr:hypothetical protein [Mucilaginibacter sp. JRF]MBE9585679.1 hypothetical protein [Mucilaginibacter sp. JRF]